MSVNELIQAYDNCVSHKEINALYNVEATVVKNIFDAACVEEARAEARNRTK